MTRTWLIILAYGFWSAAPVLLAIGCSDDTDDASEHCDHEHDDECDPSHHDPEAQVGPPSEATCPANSTLTYDNFAKGFFADYCLRCHSAKVKGDARMMAPADHNFDTLDEIDLLKKHIDEKAAAGPTVTNTSMPPSDPKPSVADRKKLGEWIACDAPE